MHTRSFGFCAFTFCSPDRDNLTLDNPQGTYSVQDWAADVETALSAIPSIYDLVVDSPNSTSGTLGKDLLSTWNLTAEDLGSTPDVYGKFVPSPASGRIYFELRLPKPIRERLGRTEATYSESFKVWINYSSGMPVTMVVGDDPRDSTVRTIPLVREFLLEEFRSRLDQMNGIEFRFLPPAPMHLQGRIDQVAGLSQPSLNVEPSKGYDVLNLTIPKDDDPDDHLRNLLHGLEDELALYYSAVGANHYQNDVDRFLNVFADSIVSSYRERGLRSYGKQLFSGYRKAANLQIMAIETDLLRQQTGRSLRDATDERQRLTGGLVLSDWLEREISQLERSSSPEVGRIASLVSNGLSHSVQSAAVLGSAVLGGSIGAALTAFLT